MQTKFDMIVGLTIIYVLEIHSDVTDACFGGQGCPFECHCETSGCDSSTGSCDNHGGCDDDNRNGDNWRGDWAGPGCQIGNVAYGKLATQGPETKVHISTNGQPLNNPASRAVDGNTNPDLDKDSCSHPFGSSISNPPWWKVDLGSDQIIYNVTIVNRDSNQARLQNTDIQYSLDNITFTTCGNTGPLLNIDQITIDCGTVRARYIRLFRRTNAGDIHEHEEYLNICEVMVTGYKYNVCSPGSYGPGCLLSCGNCMDCDDVTGNCSGLCQPGWMGDKCSQYCDDYRWGPNCASSCHLCRDNVTCERVNGRCPACPDYHYGDNCEIDRYYEFQAPSIFITGSYSYDVEIHLWESSIGGNVAPDSYIIQYRVEGQGLWMDGTIVQHGDDGAIVKVEQRGLQPGTAYKFRYQPAYDGNRGRPSRETDTIISEQGPSRTISRNICVTGTFGADCKGTCRCKTNDRCDEIYGVCADGLCEQGWEGYACQTPSSGISGKGMVATIFLIVGVVLVSLVCQVIAIFFVMKHWRKKPAKINSSNSSTDPPTDSQGHAQHNAARESQPHYMNRSFHTEDNTYSEAACRSIGGVTLTSQAGVNSDDDSGTFVVEDRQSCYENHTFRTGEQSSL